MAFKSFAAYWLNPSSVIKIGFFHLKTHQNFFITLTISRRRMQCDILWVTYIESGHSG